MAIGDTVAGAFENSKKIAVLLAAIATFLISACSDGDGRSVGGDGDYSPSPPQARGSRGPMSDVLDIIGQSDGALSLSSKFDCQNVDSGSADEPSDLRCTARDRISFSELGLFFESIYFVPLPLHDSGLAEEIAVAEGNTLLIVNCRGLNGQDGRVFEIRISGEIALPVFYDLMARREALRSSGLREDFDMKDYFDFVASDFSFMKSCLGYEA